MTLAKYMIFALLVCAAVSSPVYDAVDVNDNSEAAEGEDLLERLASHLQQRIARGSSSGAGGATVAASGNDASANVAANSQSQGGPYYNGNSGSGSGTASGTGNSISGAAAGTGTATGSGNTASATGGAYGTAAGRDGYLNLQGNADAATGTGGYFAQSGAGGNGGGNGRRGSASITSGANTNGGRVRGGRSIAVWIGMLKCGDVVSRTPINTLLSRPDQHDLSAPSRPTIPSRTILNTFPTFLSIFCSYLLFCQLIVVLKDPFTWISCISVSFLSMHLTHSFDQ